MKLDGRRESTNVEDRRGKGGAMKAGGLGLGGIVVAIIIYFLTGQAPDSSMLQQMGQGTDTEYTDGKDYSQVDVELMTFCKQILAGTEDVWTQEFRKIGRTYQPPKMVIFAGSVQSGCGSATSESGPFYCSADQTVYLDLDFFKTMRSQIGADGDFAYAYVIAHEVGHHVQNLLGTLSQAHNQMSRVNQTQSNQISVRLELQADFYAGIWGYYDNKMFGSLEDGDIQEALNAASKIGDDYLQKKAQGYVQPESFTHGTSAQRQKWLKLGIQTGNMNTTTFGISESEL